MLLRFSANNFKSFGSEGLSLSTVSSTKVRKHSSHVIADPIGPKVLRNTAIYGGNAAGKTNVVQALKFMADSISQGLPPMGFESSYCKMLEQGREEPSTFDIQIGINDKFYDYGFSCVLAERQITSEWLYELGTSEPRHLFSWDHDSDMPSFGLLKLGADDVSRLRVYAEDFASKRTTNKSGLFLTKVNRSRVFDDDSPLSFFSNVYSWFTEHISFVLAGKANPRSRFYRYADLDDVAEVLASFDTGINRLSRVPVTFDEFVSMVGAQTASELLESLEHIAAISPSSITTATLRSEDTFIGIEIEDSSAPSFTTLAIGHEGSLESFAFSEESDGSKRLFEFMDLLFTDATDTLFVVDEINRNFHPFLTRQLVDLFNEVHANDSCQLLFTTHENDIMTLECLRKDEIWFVERSFEGYSKLYPLDEFEVKSDARVGKIYMNGRYGGVPALNPARAMMALTNFRESKGINCDHK